MAFTDTTNKRIEILDEIIRKFDILTEEIIQRTGPDNELKSFYEYGLKHQLDACIQSCGDKALNLIMQELRIERMKKRK
jgi:hypothetical protein